MAKGRAKVKMTPKKMEAEIKRAGRRGIVKSILFLEREIKLAMKSTPRLLGKATFNRTARVYKRGNKVHHPSAEGSPPAVDRGRLINSITHSFSWTAKSTKARAPAKPTDGVKKPAKRPKQDVGVVGSNVEYFVHLEFGTFKMRARPVLRPVFAKSRKKIATFFKPGLFK